MANPQAGLQGPKKHPEVTQRQIEPPSRSPSRDRLNQKLLGITKGTSTGWKPHTMRPPVLCAVIGISLVLAGVIEYLAQMSTRQGGLALSASEDDIPYSVNIAYLYMPTTVAVLYSLLWTWIDLDIRRMQPWFELSRPGGAKGEHSLLLDYPFEFLAFVPISAWKRKQWPVFFAGIVMMLVFWTITPLQGSIFGKQAVTLTRNTPMSITSGLMDIESQATALDASILDTAYSITWYDQDLPEFTTAEYALLPFSPVENKTRGSDEEWTFNTTKFVTDLDCWSATYTQVIKSVRGGQYLFDNGEGCLQNISLTGGMEDHYNMQYIGWKGDAHLDWSLHSTECGSAFSHQFLAIFAHGTGNGSNATFDTITSMFCEPSYTQQDVSISVVAATGQPVNDSLIELAPPSTLDDTTFNNTAFEFLLHAGFSSITTSRDYPNNLILDQYAVLYDSNISWPTTNMVGFAMGLYDGSMEDFLNTSILHSAFAAAHKLIFSSAISQLSTQALEAGTADGSVKYTLYGIVVSRPISIAVESLLLVVAILAAALLYAIVRSTSHLARDPDSTASLFGMIQSEETILSHFSDKDRLSLEKLQTSVSDNLYCLEASDNTAEPTLQIVSTELRTDSNDDAQASTASASDSKPKSIRPKELQPVIGVLFILILAAAIGVLGYLKHQEKLLNGLIRPSQNFEVLQILENYIPMVFSTLLEPFLTLLNRLLCVLQPYYDLMQGRSSPRSNIETKYDSLPPQLIIWRALKAGHYFLAILSVVVLLANVLSVALGAIFNESPISVSTTLNVTSLISTSISRGTIVDPSARGNSPYYDHFYLVETNMSANTRLPSWIDSQFAYLPFADLTASDNTSAQYSAVTRGFGFEATCSPISTSNTSANYVDYVYYETWEGQQPIKVYYENATSGNSTICEPAATVFYVVNEGKSAQEIYTTLTPASDDTTATENFCGSRLLLAWMRYDSADADMSPNTTSTWLDCTTQMVSAEFNVTVDGDGRVLRSDMIGDYDNITDIIGPNVTDILVSANTLIGDASRQSSGGVSELAWHNDSLTTDWMNYYLVIGNNTRDYVNPNKSLPGATNLIPTVEKIYQRIGAALLGTNQDLFLDTNNTTPTLSAVMVTQETRIFMDKTALIISLTILGIYLLIGIAFYAGQRRIPLPRMPTTIGSIIGFVAASRAVRMYRKPGKKDSPKATYGFGEYVGVDGKGHLGIELNQYVVPLKPKSSWSWSGTQSWCRRRLGRTKGAEATVNNGPS